MFGGTLGPYRLDRELGAGGMGKVYAATVAGRCPGLVEGTRVALKVVHPHLLETPNFFKRFLREAEIGKSVVHENVVRTFDCDSLSVDGKRADFLVMEYVEGQTLRGLLAELERVPEELCRHIGREVAKGLAAIHAAGVVHRDMKPENVLITGDQQVKVMDLGVARLQDEAMRLSQTGAFVGSIHYAAPECFREGGKHVDGRADLHALGLVLYELACGVNPYLADDIPQVLRKVLHEEPRRLGDVNPQISPFFEEAVHTLLAKDPAARFADAAALLAVLEGGEDSIWWTSRAKAIRAETKRPLRRIRIPRDTAVYGRDAELTKLRALFETAKAGEGRVVLLEGEAGIGKSRLVDELVARLQRDGEDLNFLFGSYPPGGAATASGALSMALREHVGEAGVAPYLPQTPLLVPAFEALLKGDAAPSGSEPLTPNSIATCFVQALRALSAERTTVLLVDDLHFAGDDSRALFTALALAVAGHRLLLVGTSRPGIDEKWRAELTRFPQTSQLPVGRLGPKDLALLLADSFRSEHLATSLGHQIAVKSDGNPFFAFEIIRGLREGQFITQRDDGTWVSTGVIDEIRIPSSILDLVNARVADLTEDERALLDIAACWGFEFDPGLVGEVLGLARIPALRAFGQIERQHRLVRSSGRMYVFDHHQVQEALYGSINEQLREEYHAALASALETRTASAAKDPATLDGALCVDLCEHFLKGTPCVAAGGAQGTGTVPDEGREPDSPGASQAVPRNSATALPAEHRALRYLSSALSHLEKGYLNDAAARLDERALGVPGLLAGRERVEVLLRRAERLDVLARRDAERAALDEAKSLADALGEPVLRARVLRTLGAGHLVEVARMEEAESSLLAALELARAAGDRTEEVAAELGLGRVCAAQIRREEGRAHYQRALLLCREAGNRRGEAAAELGLGNVQPSHAEAHEYRERALAIFREVGNRRGESAATANLGIGLYVLGRYAEARDRHERQLAIARETGDRVVEAAALASLGNCHRGLGESAAARRRFEESLALCRAIRAVRGEGYALWGLADVADATGDAAAARAFAEAALALRRELRDVSVLTQSLVQVAELRSRAGDTGAARSAIEELLRLSRELGGAEDVALALALSACLPGEDAGAAVDAFAAAGAAADTAKVRWLLWRATGDRTHLAAAKRRLDETLARIPPEHHEARRTNDRLYREILAACAEQGV